MVTRMKPELSSRNLKNNRVNIEQVINLKYLGINMNEGCVIKEQIRRKTSQAKNAFVWRNLFISIELSL